VLASEFAYLGLHHPAQGKQGAAELVLSQTEQEISLILGPIRGALEQPTSDRLIKLHPGVMTGSQGIGANLLGHNQ
jgi:hypothetical protein